MPGAPEARPEIQGFVLETPRNVGIPELSMADGTPFDKSVLEGRWNLVFYGYTHCPDICPITLSTVAEAKKQTGGFPQVVFISVDPKRDDAKLVGEYAAYFDPDFICVTGDEANLQAMAMQMSVVAEAQPADENGEYLVDHSSALMLLNPDVKLAAMLQPPHSVESIVDAVTRVKASYIN